MNITDEDLLRIRMAHRKDAIAGKFKLMTDVESEYGESKYLSYHKVVVQDLSEGSFYRLTWDETQEDDAEILKDSVRVTEVVPRTVTTTTWEEA